MEKTDIEKMAQKLASGKASVIEIPAAKMLAKANAPELMDPDDSDWRKPRVYIDSDTFPGFKKREAGDKAILLVECEVRSVKTYEHTEHGKKESGYNMELVIGNMAEVN